MNKRVKNKNIIIQLYLDGYNGNEIAELKELNNKTVQRILREFKKELSGNKLNNFELVHKKNRAIKLEARSNEKRANNKIISEQALIRWNRQSYISVGKKGEKHSLVFDSKRGSIPYGMPKIFRGTI